MMKFLLPLILIADLRIFLKTKLILFRLREASRAPHSIQTFRNLISDTSLKVMQFEIFQICHEVIKERTALKSYIHILTASCGKSYFVLWRYVDLMYHVYAGVTTARLPVHAIDPMKRSTP